MTINESENLIIATQLNDEPDSSLLPTLPNEIKYVEIPSFSLNLCGLFAQTSNEAEKETAFLRLLSSAVDAEPESYQQENITKLAALAILKKWPALLFRKGMVTDHFGRKIWASPYQLFLGTGDVWALKQVHDEIIPKITDGLTQAENQFHQQFPNCPWPPNHNLDEKSFYDDRNKSQIAMVVAQLEIIVASITADPCTEGRATLPETIEAVAALSQLFAPKEGEVIRTGLHFPFAIMEAIYGVYKIHFDEWQRSERLAFYSREVIGRAEAALTAVDGQCCKAGLHVKLELKLGPDRRDGLFCRHPKGIPAELAPIREKLGHTMFVDPSNGYACALGSDVGSYRWYNKNGHVSEFNDKFRVNGCGKWVIRWVQAHMNNKNRDLYTVLSDHTKTNQQRHQLLQQRRP